MLTIDAVSAGFARQAPLTTGLGAMPAFVDDATAHHREAVVAALAAARADDPAWRTFLAHLDNDARTVVDLLAQMLAKRDQWRLGPAARRGGYRAARRARTGIARRDGAGAARRSSGASRARSWQRLRELMRHAVAQLEALRSARDAPPPMRRARTTMRRTTSSSRRSRASRARRPAAAGCGGAAAVARLAGWLLLKDKPRFRATFNKNSGFPPKARRRRRAQRGGQGGDAGVGRRGRRRPGPRRGAGMRCAGCRPAATTRMRGRSSPPRWHCCRSWRRTCNSCSRAPARATSPKRRCARSTALGDADAPGDLLLATDLRLAHVLVDEFQDTSWVHAELLGRLTSGWLPDDGRTLFVVGDPMQSIYRFRAAEVGIFLAAQEQRHINDVPVECLTLARNFRSQAPVVAWVNDVFAQVLGPTSDPLRGDVAYEPVLATRAAPRRSRARRHARARRPGRGARGRAARAGRATRRRARHRHPRARALAPRRDPAGAAARRRPVYGRRTRAARGAPRHARPADADPRFDAAGRHAGRARAAARAVVRAAPRGPAADRGSGATRTRCSAAIADAGRARATFRPTARRGWRACARRWRPRWRARGRTAADRPRARRLDGAGGARLRRRRCSISTARTATSRRWPPTSMAVTCPTGPASSRRRARSSPCRRSRRPAACR